MRRGSKLFSTYNIALMSVLTAMSCVLFYVPHFPIFPQATYLKVDFSDVPVVFAGMHIHPLAAVIIAVLKNLIGLTHTDTGGIGELSNMILSSTFGLIASGFTSKKKPFAVLAIFSAASILVTSGMAMLSNYYVIFPLYGIPSTWEVMFTLILPFNLIKFSIQSTVVLSFHFVLKDQLLKLKKKSVCKLDPNDPFCKETQEQTPFDN